tara:strand:- start:269 stop:697 length:429 start_codon:yes stop_codon:yes gene_type:complete
MEVSDAVLKLDVAKAEALSGKSPDPMIKLQENELRLKAMKQSQDYELAVGEQVMQGIKDSKDHELKQDDQVRKEIKDEQAHELKQDDQMLKGIKDVQDHELKKGDQAMEEVEIMIDDVNADEDREMKLKIEQLKLEGKSYGS